MNPLYQRDSFLIRPVVEEDVPAVVHLEQSLYSTPWSEQSFRFELTHERSRFWVFESAGLLAGYQVGWIIVNSYHLHNLAIAPHAQGQGLAAEVLDFMCQYLARLALSCIELEVRAANVRALALYRKAGFKIVGIRRRYYRQPFEDAILMQNLI